MLRYFWNLFIFFTNSEFCPLTLKEKYVMHLKKKKIPFSAGHHRKQTLVSVLPLCPKHTQPHPNNSGLSSIGLVSRGSLQPSGSPGGHRFDKHWIASMCRRPQGLRWWSTGSHGAVQREACLSECFGIQEHPRKGCPVKNQREGHAGVRPGALCTELNVKALAARREFPPFSTAACAPVHHHPSTSLSSYRRNHHCFCQLP